MRETMVEADLAQRVSISFSFRFNTVKRDESVSQDTRLYYYLLDINKKKKTHQYATTQLGQTEKWELQHHS